MWYLPKLTVRGIMLKAEDGFEAAVDFCCLQVQVTNTEIVEWVGDMVG